MRGAGGLSLIAALATFTAAPVLGQADGDGPPAWLTVGMGPLNSLSNTKDPPASSVLVLGHLTLRRASGLWTVGASGDLIDLDSNIDETYEFSVLYGRGIEMSSAGSHLAGSIGLSLGRLRTCKRSCTSATVLGLPFLVQFTVGRGSWGFGGELFTMLNSHRSYASLAAAVQLRARAAESDGG